jgi:hypothetical protein
MPTKILLGLALLAIAACAAPGKSAVVDERSAQAAHPLFVGHGSDGETVMASTHYDSINGLSVASQDVGVTAGKDDRDEFVCKRETLTGTHMPQWICRYKAEVEEDRMRTQRMFDNMPKGCTEKGCNQ